MVYHKKLYILERSVMNVTQSPYLKNGNSPEVDVTIRYRPILIKELYQIGDESQRIRTKNDDIVVIFR